MSTVKEHRVSSSQRTSMPDFDVNLIRQDFPILAQQVRGNPLVYLDSAATAQKPRVVIEALERYYSTDNANVHRGVHSLSERATEAYESAREKVRAFINAGSMSEIVFVRGTTEAINLVAQSWGRPQLKEGDEILISEMEHHSNIVPWQMLCRQTGATLKVALINDAGELNLEEFKNRLSERTRLVSIVHCSNALGTINPVKELVDLAHGIGAVVFLDGAQAAPHFKIDVQKLGCDFYGFSGHKLYGPTGIGVLYGREKHLAAMPPYQGGGEMIKFVTFDETIYNDLPYKFEAGTPHIAGAVGLGAAIDYLTQLGMDAVAAYEHELFDYVTTAVARVPELRVIGTARKKAGILSFELDKIHPHDIGTILDHYGIAIRTGHHCAMPVMQRFGVPATARASFALYNTREDVDALFDGIAKVIEAFK